VKCDLHGHSVAIAGHAKFCPYKECKCRKCRNHDKFLAILGEERKIRKFKKTRKKVRKVGGPVNHILKQEVRTKERKIRKVKKTRRKVRKVGNPANHVLKQELRDKECGKRKEFNVKKSTSGQTPLTVVKEKTIFLSSSSDSETGKHLTEKQSQAECNSKKSCFKKKKLLNFLKTRKFFTGKLKDDINAVKDETSSSSEEDELPEPEDFQTAKVLPNILLILSRGYHQVNTKLSAPTKIPKIAPVSITKHGGVSSPSTLPLLLSSSSTSSSIPISRPKKARPFVPVVIEITSSSSSSDSDSSVEELSINSVKTANEYYEDINEK